MTSSKKNRIESFNFKPGRTLLGKYEVVSKLGGGWESEVYLIREVSTGIERAAKFFFPHRNEKNKTALIHASKLHKLRSCPIVVNYHSQEKIRFQGQDVTTILSEYIEGDILTDFLSRQPSKKLTPFAAIHLLHSLASGLDQIHQLGEYHGDLHAENIIVRHVGLGFKVRVLDMYYWKAPRRENIQDDICNLIKVFHESMNGQKNYSKFSPQMKSICCGLKRSLILKKFKTAGALKNYLEVMEWN